MAKMDSDDTWSSVLAPLEVQITRGEQVYTSLLRSILTGMISPGQHLVEQTLADKLSVSRISIREAIRRLAQDELVEIIPNRGAFVVNLTAQDVEEIFRLRSALECLAIERVTTTVPDKDLLVFESQLAEMAVLEKQEDRLNGAGADTRFHRTIMELSGQHRIFQVWQRMYAQITVVVYNVSNYYSSYQGLAERHTHILELIRARDPKAAREYLHEHIIAGAQSLIAAMAEAAD